MSVWLKPEIVLAALLALAAIVLIFAKRDEVRAVEREVSEKGVTRGVAKSGYSPGKSGVDYMPRLSQWPSAKVVSVNLDWGFVVLKPDNLTVAQGDIAFLEGVPRREAWVRITSADERHLVADLNGDATSQLSPGDRVIFSHRPVRTSSSPHANVDPGEFRWTDADSGDWMK